eukprot:CAMPEP_0181108638 /NCGR_PEP_ID=MMETSP1071-20121207/17736_1 /TAXON_ID=35127 /ORGANISM="Thalassiosira sp., Strain NH16" /LENGTH=104 /DNA_ID=CAMNT_0023192253 /DNA_START=324 /DNA_END=635 /DNA_ORIENTATION=+
MPSVSKYLLSPSSLPSSTPQCVTTTTCVMSCATAKSHASLLLASPRTFAHSSVNPGIPFDMANMALLMRFRCPYGSGRAGYAYLPPELLLRRFREDGGEEIVRY